MSKLFSSRQIIKILYQHGFIYISQRGSHSKYRKHGQPTLTVIVPIKRKKIPYGTFKSILRQSGLNETSFKS